MAVVAPPATLLAAGAILLTLILHARRRSGLRSRNRATDSLPLFLPLTPVIAALAVIGPAPLTVGGKCRRRRENAK